MTDFPDLSALEPDIQQAARVYRGYMDEIKTRLGVIQNLVDGMRARPDDPLGFIQAECAILQLRNVCELMSHAALAAYHPFGLSDRLLDSWNARLAFEELRLLNPNCFPRPIRGIEVKDDGHKQLDITAKGLPTLRGLLRLYLRCGSLLHRGIVRHAFEGTQKLYDVDWVDDWGTRIGELLVNHTMLIVEKGVVFLASFYNGEEAETRVAIAMADGPARLVEPGKESPPAPPEGEQPHPQ